MACAGLGVRCPNWFYTAPRNSLVHENICVPAPPHRFDGAVAARTATGHHRNRVACMLAGSVCLLAVSIVGAS